MLLNFLQLYESRSILISGSTGYIATRLMANLKKIHCKISRLSRHGTNFLPAVGAAEVIDVTGNFNDPAAWIQPLASADVIFHLAAQTSLYVAEQDPLADFMANVAPLLALLQGAAKTGRKPHIILASTAMIYGSPSSLPADESASDKPSSIYELHKLMAEQYLLQGIKQGIVTGCILRLTNVYGPGKSRSPDRGVLTRMISKAVDGEPLTAYKDAYFLRDYIYIDDVTDAFLAAGCQPEKVNGQRFIIGTGTGCTVIEAINRVAQMVSEIHGTTVAVELVDPPANQSPAERREFIGNSDAFSAATGWQAQIDLNQGIRQTIEELCEGASPHSRNT